ncbi:hypothetical protein [Burkholderia alba]|uniref:hypothetical protein n=1 Tax=Burkholderia alba TaxID=2683677 RepID=UPI002B059E2B|nr:hypothetical protein [Burkholderia alba]
MSDGPHRSLPMRKAWKELAKRGDQSTYDLEQVTDAAKHALARDFRKEVDYSVIKALKDVFTGRDNSLGLPEIALQQLEEARTLAAGSVFGLNAVAWGVYVVNSGRLDEDAFLEAIGFAAKERGIANTRQIEEHYLRKSNMRRANDLRVRLYTAISGMSEKQLGLALVAPETAHKSTLRKRSELSDGVPL